MIGAFKRVTKNGVKNTGKMLLAWESHKQLWLFFGRIWKSLFRKPMALNDPGAPDMTDWAQVEAHWGFCEDDRVRLVKGYRRQMWIGITISALAAAGVLFDQMYSFGKPSLQALIVVLLLFILACTIGFGSAWRSWMLENKKFQPFMMWLGLMRDERFW